MIDETKKSIIVVARWVGWEAKDKPAIDEFAYSGHETGMGRTIEHTTDISQAEDCSSAHGIMRWMGGHYRGYEAVEIEVEKKYKERTTLKFPLEEDVW